METIFSSLLGIVTTIWMSVFGMTNTPLVKTIEVSRTVAGQVATESKVDVLPSCCSPDVSENKNVLSELLSNTRRIIATPTEIKFVSQTVELDKNIVGDKVYSNDELLAMAGPKLTTLPLGDNKYSTTGAKVGYVYLCNAPRGGGPGAGTVGPWIKGKTWTPSEKVEVSGNVTWSQAWFSNIVSGVKRLITGNNLPINHTTGTYPVAQTDDAYSYDRNPNSIKTQNMNYSLSASPVYSATPNCMGGEVGVMLSGVPLFNGFDAQGRDAQANEVQDACDGHPQERGQYHYHGMSDCFTDISVTKVLGYALDGFPITGPKVAENKYLSTDDLDICHGITSEVIMDGKKVTTYHYVMTQDFPYSAGCFRGTPIKVGNNDGGQKVQQQAGANAAAQGQQGQGVPPKPALDACSGKTSGNSCSVQTPKGTLTGNCNYTPDQKYFACIPANR